MSEVTQEELASHKAQYYNIFNESIEEFRKMFYPGEDDKIDVKMKEWQAKMAPYTNPDSPDFVKLYLDGPDRGIPTRTRSSCPGSRCGPLGSAGHGVGAHRRFLSLTSRTHDEQWEEDKPESADVEAA